jgi:8-oxo-dGTP pyrophosphatase MutT (NUDIX family)
MAKANANVNYGEPKKFMKILKRAGVPDAPGKPDNAIMILLILVRGVWRVVMNVEFNHKKGGLHWAFPGGKVDRKDPSAWKGAHRELEEETGHVFNSEDWDRASEVKRTLVSKDGSTTRVYCGIYTPRNPWCMKSKPDFPGSAEVLFVEMPRLSAVKKSLEDGSPLSCGAFQKIHFRREMWRIGLPFKEEKKNAEEEKDD